MGELNEQIHIEDHTLGVEEGDPDAPGPVSNVLLKCSSYTHICIATAS